MKRVLCLLLGAALFAVSVLPVTVRAVEHDSAWIELLETATVNDSGSNVAKVVGKAGVFRIKTPQYTKLTKIDLVLTHPSGYAPSSVEVEYNGNYYMLSREQIDDYTSRFYSNSIPDNLYADVVIKINKTYNDYTCYYQFISCKVSPLVTDEFVADAYVRLDGGVHYSPFAFSQPANAEADNVNYAFQFPLVVTDWEKFDKIVVSGSIDRIALNSVRATLGGLGLPYEITYTVTNSAGSDSVTYEDSETTFFEYDQSYFTSTEGKTFETSQYTGKVLFTLTVDLTGVDRTNPNDLYIYFTGLANDYNGYLVQIVGVTGHIYIADTTGASWWSKLTAFFTDLFDGDSSEAEEFGSSMESQAGEMQDAVDEMDQVTKPNVDDLDVSLDQYMGADGMAPVNDVLGAIFSNEIIVTMFIICLTCAFASYALFGKR